MKYTALLIAVLTNSLPLYGMFKVPNVTRHQEICKDPEQKKRLTQIYTNFCRERLYKTTSLATAFSAGYIATSITMEKLVKLTPINSRIINGMALLCWFFPMRALNKYRRAQDGDFSYLDQDILKQLGNPKTVNGSMADCYCWQTFETDYEKGLFGYRKEMYQQHFYVDISTIGGIKTALSGNYKSDQVHDSQPSKEDNTNWW